MLEVWLKKMEKECLWIWHHLAMIYDSWNSWVLYCYRLPKHIENLINESLLGKRLHWRIYKRSVIAVGISIWLSMVLKILENNFMISLIISRAKFVKHSFVRRHTVSKKIKEGAFSHLESYFTKYGLKTAEILCCHL